MKKFFFLAVALIAALGFTSCKFEETKATITVLDKNNQPIANTKVYKVDLATAIIDIVAPEPSEPLLDDNGKEYEHRTTNAEGKTTFTWNMGVKSMEYLFYVPDPASGEWAVQRLKVQRGALNELTIKFGDKENDNTAKVTVTVVDQDKKPVADRKVYAVDIATAIINIIAPDPTEPLVDDNGEEYPNFKTNAEGKAEFTLTTFKSLKYTFYVPDLGADEWVTKTIDVKKGEDQAIEIEVNK